MLLKLVQFLIQWWVKQFFVTIMNNVTASQPAYPPIPKFAKMDFPLTIFFFLAFNFFLKCDIHIGLKLVQFPIE